MDFITLTETAGAAIVDVYNLALVKTSETGSKVESARFSFLLSSVCSAASPTST
jgi:hypothetical protein